MTAFKAPSLQDFAAIGRTHALTEAMLLTALTLLGLIRSFTHGVTSVKKILNWNSQKN